jgi:hypothetical protein
MGGKPFFRGQEAAAPIAADGERNGATWKTLANSCELTPDYVRIRMFL